MRLREYLHFLTFVIIMLFDTSVQHSHVHDQDVPSLSFNCHWKKDTDLFPAYNNVCRSFTGLNDFVF